MLDERDHHRYVHLDSRGRKTGAYVYFSHGGAASREVADSLLKPMRFQLGLQTTRQVRDLLECPMDSEAFEKAREAARPGSGLP